MKWFILRPMVKKFDQKMPINYRCPQSDHSLRTLWRDGSDHRIREHLITKEITVGDYVLTVENFPQLSWRMPLVRLIPEPFGDDNQLSPIRFRIICSHHLFTLPQSTRWKAPDILLSGHRRSDEWNHQQSVERTKTIETGSYWDNENYTYNYDYWYYIGIINLISGFIFAFDKQAAIKGRRRIPERTTYWKCWVAYLQIYCSCTRFTTKPQVKLLDSTHGWWWLWVVLIYFILRKFLL